MKITKTEKMALNIKNIKTNQQNHKINTIKIIYMILKIGCSKYIYFLFALKHPIIAKKNNNNLSALLSFICHEKNPLYDIDLFFGPLTRNRP